MAKLCKNCGGPTPPPHLNKFCSQVCHNAGGGKMIKRTALKRPTEIKISAVSKTNKNTPAKFSQKTKDEIYERQGGKCLIYPDEPIDEYHHAFYGPIAANYGPSRNDADQGVGLSSRAHYEIHHGKGGEGKVFRARCIIYLKKLCKLENKV